MAQRVEVTGLQKTFLENGEIHIDGEIDEEMADYVHACFQHLKAHGSPDIKCFIRSSGGVDPCGFHIYDEIRHYAGNTRGVVNGFAYSMATLVLQACIERVAYPHSTFLVHKTSLTVDGQVSAQQLTKKYVQELKKEMRLSTARSSRILEVHTDLTHHEIRDLMALDKILTAEEALNLGLIDDIC